MQPSIASSFIANEYLKQKLVDNVDAALYKKLDNYIFQGHPLASILKKYHAETQDVDDSDGKTLYGYLIGELRSIRKDREDLVEIIVKYLMENDHELVDALAEYLTKKLSEQE